jgi:type I restriction enzyme S subunit
MYPLRCKPSLLPEFLLGLLLSTAFTTYATAESVRAQMPKLNRETLFAYRFPAPSLKLQLHFAEQAAAVRSIQTQQSLASSKAQATFDALMAQVFQP